MYTSHLPFKRLFIFSFLYLNFAFSQLSQADESTVVRKDIFSQEMVEGYHKNSKVQWNLAMDILSEYSFTGNEKVLDIGCGDGKITEHIARLVPQGCVVGLDISPQMIAFASKTYPPEKHPNLYFIHGDGGNLPNHEEYDSVVSFCSLHWIPSQFDALKGIYNSLKVGGSMLAVVPVKGNNDLFHLIQELAMSDKWKPYFQHIISSQKSYEAKDYAELLFNVGFLSPQVTTKLVETTFDDNQDLKEWLVPLFTTFRNLPEKQRTEFLQDYVDLIITHYPPNEEGKITVPAACIILNARKIPLINIE